MNKIDMKGFTIEHIIYDEFEYCKIPNDASVVISGDTRNPRGRIETLKKMYDRNERKTVSISEKSIDKIKASYSGNRSFEEINLKNISRIQKTIPDSKSVWIDVSGLSFNVWGPILKAIKNKWNKVAVIYTEPKRYAAHPKPVTKTQFDLTTEYREVSPPPGLANIRGPKDEGKTIFIPFLGFEGNRVRNLAVSLDPVPSRIIPIVGVPGFKAEYPQFSVFSNMEFLESNNCFDYIRMSRANSPFDANNTLEAVNNEFKDYYFYIAPLGTTPSTLGVLIYFLKNDITSEIMYDNPLSEPGSRSGIGKTHVYFI